METLQLSHSKGYSTGGTLHIIVNNQICFTTPNPIEVEFGREARTSRYCTDLAKMLEAPVFHVNGDDPEAVTFVTRLAMDFRNEFHKDVIVDRSEEHTSELQSLMRISYAVFCLKKKKNKHNKLSHVSVHRIHQIPT